MQQCSLYLSLLLLLWNKYENNSIYNGKLQREKMKLKFESRLNRGKLRIKYTFFEIMGNLIGKYFYFYSNNCNEPLINKELSAQSCRYRDFLPTTGRIGFNRTMYKVNLSKFMYLFYTLHRCLEHVPIVLSFLRLSLSLYPCLQIFPLQRWDFDHFTSPFSMEER